MRNGKNETKIATLEARLASFDQATERQRKRNLLATNAGVGSRASGRGWKRDELYGRGVQAEAGL
ncbi:MAG: hypothetical protein WBQ43_24680 [Terriglobales bacterium]